MHRKIMKSLLLSLLIMLMLLACQKKTEVVTISGWEKFDDFISKISITYPQGWTLTQDQTGVMVYSNPEIVSRFTDLTPIGPDGVRLVVNRTRMDSLSTFDQYVEKIRDDLSVSGYDVKPIENKTLAGLPGKFFECSGYLDNRNKLSSTRIFALKDTMLYSASYEGFNKAYELNKFVLDTLLNSLKFTEAAPKVVGNDPAMPSSNFADFNNNNYLSLKYPDNFDLTTPAAKAPAEFSLDIRGYRQDSNVHLDIIPAKGLSMDKVVEQNSKNYKPTAKGSVNIDGVNTTYLDYRPVKEINSRVYFLVKNDRFFRIIFNYYAPMKEKYLSTFEKVVTSIKVK
jgi:hypothetical protein